MNSFNKKVLVVLLLAASTAAQLVALQPRKKGDTTPAQQPKTPAVQARTAARSATKKEKPLKAIRTQAEILYTSDDKVERANARKEIDRLMKEIKKTDSDMARAIKKEIDILKTTTDSEESKSRAEEAYVSLDKKINVTKAKANVSRVAAREIKRIEMAETAEDRNKALALAAQNMKIAEEKAKQASYTSRAFSAAKGFYELPSNLLGIENTMARHAVNAAVGVAYLAGGYYLSVPTKVAKGAATVYGMLPESAKGYIDAAGEYVGTKAAAIGTKAAEWGTWAGQGLGVLAKDAKDMAKNQALATGIGTGFALTSTALAKAVKMVSEYPEDPAAREAYENAYAAHQINVEKLAEEEFLAKKGKDADARLEAAAKARLEALRKAETRTPAEELELWATEKK